VWFCLCESCSTWDVYALRAVCTRWNPSGLAFYSGPDSFCTSLVFFCHSQSETRHRHVGSLVLIAMQTSEEASAPSWLRAEVFEAKDFNPEAVIADLRRHVSRGSAGGVIMPQHGELCMEHDARQAGPHLDPPRPSRYLWGPSRRS
jgi:hypothetical protein